MNKTLINLPARDTPAATGLHYKMNLMQSTGSGNRQSSFQPGFPPFHLLYKSIRNSMCSLSVSLQYTDYASAESAAVVSRLCNAVNHWDSVYNSIKNSLCVVLGNKHSWLTKILQGNDTIRQSCNDMQGDAHRWMAADTVKQQVQSGAILCYRFHSLLSHALGYMNRCETIIAAEAKQTCTAKEKQAVSQQLASSFTAEEWIAQTFELLPAISEKDRTIWLQYLQTYLPLSAWYPFANADDLFTTSALQKTSKSEKRNDGCTCSSAQTKQCRSLAFSAMKTGK